MDNLNQQINDRNNDIVQLNARVGSLTNQVTDLTTQRDAALEQAKQVVPLQKLNAQAELDRTNALARAAAAERKLATTPSVTTAPVSTLINELLTRLADKLTGK